LLHVFQGAEKYIQLHSGRVSTNVLDLVDSDLRIALSGALNRAAKEQTAVFLKGVAFESESGQVRLNVGVKPIHNKHARTTQMLITLEEQRAVAPPAVNIEVDTREHDIGVASRDRLQSLEAELQYTKENLQTTVEELETSNEELQATNEELVASNEELQSTNEELHSVNEELYTVNAEYQRKIGELTQLNNDMDNLLRSTDIGTIFIDADLCIRKFTPQIARVFNLLPQDVGRRIDAFTHNIDEPRLQEIVTRVLHSGEAFEREVRDRTGHWYFLRVLPYRSSGPDVEGVVLTLIDIAALKQVQADLQSLGREVAGILDNSTTFIYVKDLAGRYKMCNRFSEAVLGKSPEDVRGRTDHELLPLETADAIQAHDREVATTGRLHEYLEVIPTPGGEETYLAVKFPLRDEISRIYAIGAVCTNITERINNEREQQQAILRRDQFLAMLSHELRNPLGAILGAVHVMGRESTSEAFAHSRRVINRQAHHMARLLDDLLDVSRITQNKIEMRRDVCDLRRAAEDAVNSVEALVLQRKQHLSVTVPDEPVYVEGDLTRLQQIQANLLANASKYNSEGGAIWLTIEHEDSQAVIRVRDDGFGIPPEMQDSIFDLFVQSDATLDRSDGGMGVGLTLVRSIVEKHGGTIKVHSAGPGQGSEFVVKLPLTVKRPMTEPRVPSEPAQAERTRVLIIEDNCDVRDMLEMLLRLNGYQVLIASDGAMGLSIIEREHPDVALIDIGLPKLDGFEVARRVRANAANSGVLLVALTGYGQESDRIAALEAGFDAHLVKPLDTEELSKFLRQRAGGAKVT
jgi:two-component system CheB/CheR fusion protein